MLSRARLAPAARRLDRLDEPRGNSTDCTPRFPFVKLAASYVRIHRVPPRRGEERKAQTGPRDQRGQSSAWPGRAAPSGLAFPLTLRIDWLPAYVKAAPVAVGIGKLVIRLANMHVSPIDLSLPSDITGPTLAR